jgi:hypothetical protein
MSPSLFPFDLLPGPNYLALKQQPPNLERLNGRDQQGFEIRFLDRGFDGA